MENETLLSLIFWDRDQGILAQRTKEEKEIEREIHQRGNEEKLRQNIEKIENVELKNKINKYLESTLGDLLDRESVILEKYYKQGFKDAFNFVLEIIA